MIKVEEIKVCPVCGNDYTEPPALSRRDNETEICPECGMGEALEDMIEHFLNSQEGEDNE